MTHARSPVSGFRFALLLAGLVVACGGSPLPPPAAQPSPAGFAEPALPGPAPVAAAPSAQMDRAPQAGASRVALTPDRAPRFRRISDLRFSPDGMHLALVVTDARDPGPESHLWMLDVRTSELRQFTFSAKSERSPRWSPDGRTLALLSSRTGDMQLHLIAVDGGEARPLTTLAGGVHDFAWSPDGRRLAVLARAGGTEDKASDAQVADKEQDLDRIWLVERATGKASQLTHAAVRFDEIAWTAPDRLLAVATEHPRREAWDTAVYEVELGSGALSAVAHPAQPFSGLLPSPDGARIAYTGTVAQGPIPHDLLVQGLRGGPPRDLSRPVDRAVLEARWQDESTVVVRVADGFRNVLYRLGLAGAAPVRVDLPLSARAFDVARDGTVAFVGVDFDRLPELYLAPPTGPAKQVGRVQDEGWDAVALAPAFYVKVRSFDGTLIEAARLIPPRPLAARRPLVVLAHGGPNSNFSADYFWFNSWAQLLVARGFDVLLVNPRGSTGYGEAFAKADRADLGGGDYRDLLAVLDHAIAGGDVDPERLGIAGWSYGGEMTAWAIGHTRRFKAAVVGGGVVDQAAEFETENDPAGDEWQFGTPWEHPEVFRRNSPLSFIAGARTPTLIVHGEDDRNNPVGQAHALYRALQHLGVESELVIYPGEPHGPRQLRHQIDILDRMLRWFEGHLSAKAPGP